MSGRYRILGLILAAQTMANVGPLGIPAIAALIRETAGALHRQREMPAKAA